MKGSGPDLEGGVNRASLWKRGREARRGASPMDRWISAATCVDRLVSPRDMAGALDNHLPSRAARAAFAAALALWPGPAATEPSMPGPAVAARPSDAVARNAACESCHPIIAAEWRASMHRKAHTDAAYQRALAIEPLAFCRGCHAPEADPRVEAPPAIGELGVACVSCHVPSDKPPLAGLKTRLAEPPHPVERSARFSTGDACARCHEFTFPGEPPDGLKMQTTMTEHRASDAASKPCAECHMPWVGEGPARHRSHRFPSREPTSLQASMAVRARRAGPTNIEIALTPIGVGHAFPTGDLFRRIAVEAEIAGPDNQLLGAASMYLTRHFETVTRPGGHYQRRLTHDDRPAAAKGPSRVVLDLGPAGERLPISYRVTYERVAHPAGASEATAIVESSIVLAEGVVRP